jgi:dihydrodipicolinate synthase/N-acetylneuraminate lyase
MPSWGALNDREVMTFFVDVCGAFPDAQFLHYNLPRTKRVLLGPDYRRLVDAVPNLVATKNTGGGLDRAASVMTHAPELQHFFGETNFPHGCMYGECSLLASFAAMSPHKTKALFDAGRSGRLPELFKLQQEFHDMLIGAFGPVLAEERIDGAYDKMLVRLGGLEEMPLRLLSPYQCFTEEQYQACKRALCERFPEWLQQDRM